MVSLKKQPSPVSSLKSFRPAFPHLFVVSLHRLVTQDEPMDRWVIKPCGGCSPYLFIYLLIYLGIQWTAHDFGNIHGDTNHTVYGDTIEHTSVYIQQHDNMIQICLRKWWKPVGIHPLGHLASNPTGRISIGLGGCGMGVFRGTSSWFRTFSRIAEAAESPVR